MALNPNGAGDSEKGEESDEGQREPADGLCFGRGFGGGGRVAAGVGLALEAF